MRGEGDAFPFVRYIHQVSVKSRAETRAAPPPLPRPSTHTPKEKKTNVAQSSLKLVISSHLSLTLYVKKLS